MERPTIVTCAIIRKGDKILIAQRKPDSKIEANKWEFPGGKVDFGEHPEQTIVREIKEELNIDIKVEKLLKVISHTYLGKFHAILLAYETEYVSGEVAHLDVQNSAWVREEELENYDFVDADKTILASF